MKKSVRWSTITVYEFGVGLGGSAIPKRGGPSIGLARKPKCVWSSPLDVEEDALVSCNRNSECNQMMETSGEKSKRDSNEKSVQQRCLHRMSRRRKVRWIKPLERVTMLTKAGCSEKRIYRMMMESSEIAMSRRLSLSVDRSIAVGI